MDNNFTQNNNPDPNHPFTKASIWLMNPRLKSLLLVLIFVFLGSGMFLVGLMQVQNYYRQKLYDDTEANFPRHQTKQSSAPTILADGRLQVDYPKEGDTVGQTFQVSGYAQGWFEATIPVKVFDGKNNLLYQWSAMATGDNYEQTAPFKGEIVLTASPATETGRIEFDDYSMKDGNLIYQKVVNIKFADFAQTGLKTYKNDEYGFEFAYPANWTLDSALTKGKLNLWVYAGSVKNYLHDFIAPDCDYGSCIMSLADVNNPNTKGFIHLNSGNGVISMGTTYEGGPPDVPIYKFFARTSSTDVDITLQDGTYDCQKTSDLCMGFINGVIPGKHAEGTEYVNYNKFLDTLINSFKFTKN